MLTTPLEEAALVEVGHRLVEAGYEFTTITPESHRRVNARPGAERARSLRDVFGWSRPFAPTLLDAGLLAALARAGCVESQGELVASRVRFASLGGRIFVHSRFPTTDADSVFFGPDTYRYCAYLARTVARAHRAVDVGCGSGVGGLSLADRVDRIVLADINPVALRFARVNAALAGLADRVELVCGDLFENVRGDVDLVITNPPYLLDPARRVYRDGGGDLGTGLGLRIVDEGLRRIAPGGQLVLYTGAPIVEGVDRVKVGVAGLAARHAAAVIYDELDPDVFGEELETPAYAAVDRIAAVGASVTLARTA